MSNATKTLPHYYGSGSNRFWGSINSIKDETLHIIAYNAGVTLQNVEQTCLAMIADAAERSHKKQKKASKK